MNRHQLLSRTAFCLAILGTSLAAVSAARFAGGTGEPNNPYQIATPDQLIALGNDPNLWDKHFALVRDLDMKGIDPNAMSPIGTYAKPFLGVFDGRHHSISNLHMQKELDTHCGLFGCVGENPVTWDNGAPPQGHVRNLRMVDVYIRCECSAGGLAGMLGAGTIRDCSVTGTITGGGVLCATGGLVGCALGHISGCTTNVSVHGQSGVGGLIGEMAGGEATNCSSSGHVQGVSRMGGLIGTVQFWDYPRGLYEHRPEQITPPGVIRGCRSDCSVTGEQVIGGLVGHVFGDGRIEDCYALGSASGATAVGGFIGENRGSCIARCYSAGRVLGEDRTGGFMGDRDLRADANDLSRHPPSQPIIERVAQHQSTGGESGKAPRWRVIFRPGVISCFWNAEASGMLRGLGAGADTQGGLTRLTTAQMRTAESFRDFGWDFETVWMIREGEDCPRLRWEQQSPIDQR